ncbi:hypothetical protein TIFTF001_038143 [Ficus carica]|uniref:CCHC-type domain-containing protein n=1 Tax=Ficus carica TaxID=3494 RepID=A0AA88JCK8_FICCA|nr:hypothetical protein TIFTF001_038143 [Ficus carica]
MMKMFRTDIAKQVSVGSSPPTLNQEMYPKGQTNNSGQNSKQFGKNKRKGKVSGQGQLRNYPQKKNNRGNEGNTNDYPVCAQCGKKHLGVCRLGTNACYLCGKKDHYARNCTMNSQNQNP